MDLWLPGGSSNSVATVQQSPLATPRQRQQTPTYMLADHTGAVDGQCWKEGVRVILLKCPWEIHFSPLS